jgi:energy-coupling factor transporter ATP-binding protein EcfA2
LGRTERRRAHVGRARASVRTGSADLGQPTLGDALRSLEQRLFVGREAEMAAFRDWLLDRASPTPEILYVYGPGGVGKSTLLRAFARAAEALGRAAVLVDGREVAPTPNGLLRALGGSRPSDVAARLGEQNALLLFDTFEDLADLTGYLQREILGRLPLTVRVVIAGRAPAGRLWVDGDPWRRLVRPLPLASWSPDESRAYLSARGIRDVSLVEQVLAAAGGLPLALSLAADLAVQLDVRSFRAAEADWHLALRELVERLLRDVPEPGVRDLLECCAVLRQADQASLAAIAGEAVGGVGPAFDRLCRLSFVRAGQHGLVLHDDVRRVLAEDLRWRRPERYAELRLRALAYLRERSANASPVERERLFAQRLYLWAQAWVQAHSQALLFFPEESPVWVEPGRPEDHADVLRIRAEWVERALGGEVAASYDAALDRAFMEEHLAYPGTRLRIARDRDGRAIGFSTMVPVCRESVPILLRHPAHAPAVRALWPDPAQLPATADESRVFFVVRIQETAEQARAVWAALQRETFGVLALSGVYLTTTAVPARKTSLEGWGFRRIPEARSWFYGPDEPSDTYMLDLRSIGVDAWIEAIVEGRRPPRGLSADEVEPALREALLRWRDDAALAASPLADLPCVDAPRDADAVRRAVEAALARARAAAEAKDEPAFDAVELAYVRKVGSHERVAERLAVSPATFYRLLKRGVQGIGAELRGR